MRCETRANQSAARTREVREVGGWSNELKIFEHRDFLLKLRAAGNKVVYSSDFGVVNVMKREGTYVETRCRMRRNGDLWKSSCNHY